MGNITDSYIYISKEADYDPVKSIFLCVPGEYAKDRGSVEEYAVKSGWVDIVEREKSVLICPVAPNGWRELPTSTLIDTYNENRNAYDSQNGRAIWGRTGKLWPWEVIVYIAGYGDGATYAGNILVKYPNFAAAVALVDGAPDNYDFGYEPSNHWLVKSPAEGYKIKNCDIATCLWMFGKEDEKASSYFKSCNKATDEKDEIISGVPTKVWYKKGNKAEQVRHIKAPFSDAKKQSEFIYDELFSHVIRWKNSPDGTLSWVKNKKEFYNCSEYIKHTAYANSNSYDYFVHLPKGKTKADVSNLPVVISIHGRGEPAYMFAQKNGWDTLCDETKEFIMVCPDSPGNIWFINRDKDVFPVMIEELEKEYKIDRKRIYIAGFSNGAMMTRELAYTYPNLIAKIASSNGPWFDTCNMEMIDASAPPKDIHPEIKEKMKRFSESKYHVPAAFFYGLSDPTCQENDDPAIKVFLSANECDTIPSGVLTEENHFTREAGYNEGDRFNTKLFRSTNGKIEVLVTNMKDMPHGAISEEAKLTWDFFCDRL